MFALSAFVLPAAASGRCPAQGIDRSATVEFVHDGDTLRLVDGTDVRLIGINTPEIGHGDEPDEPFADAARSALREMVAAANGRIDLRAGREPRDRYGRLLAHAYLPEGRSVGRILLERGLGWRITVPPNTGQHACYARAERRARQARRGIWGVDRLRGVPASTLDRQAGGFRLVEGTISRVGESRSAFWLELDGLTLRLPKDDLHYFDSLEPTRLQGRSLRVRGWIYRASGQLRMNLHHPAAVQWLGPP